MSYNRTDYYYMNTEERRAYHRNKNREYVERKAALLGRTIKPHDPNSHPSKMSHKELLAYKRECARRYKERHNLIKT